MSLLGAVVLLFGGGACADDGGADPGTATAVDPPAVEAATLDVVAKDYAFEAPTEIRGGLVELTYTNEGKEPHFAAMVKAAPGTSFEDVKAALLSAGRPAAGPPPFEPFGGAPTADPASGATTMTFNVPAGTYALFCAIPSPDGVPHIAKGMVRELTVTDGPTGELPEVDGMITASDFALGDVPDLAPGKAVLALRNEGAQVHEINLIELRDGRTIDDAVRWLSAPSGPPPHRALSGVAVKPGEEGTAEFDLRPGADYAFVCIIPDQRGDGAPHVAKGMWSPAFRVSEG